MAAITTENILSKSYIVYAAQSVQSLLYPTAVKVLGTVDTTLRNILGNNPYNKLKFGDFQSSTNTFATSITNIFNGAKLLIAGEITVSSFVNLTITNLGLDKIVTTYVGFIEDLIDVISSDLSGIKKVPGTFNTNEVNSGGTTTNSSSSDTVNITQENVVVQPPGNTDTTDSFSDTTAGFPIYRNRDLTIQYIEP